MREAIVHVRLLDEGTDCSRPVTALEVAAGIFSLIPSEDYDPDDEKWEFPPGSLVKVVQLQSGSESFTLAIARFDCAEKVIRWQPDLDLPRNLDTPVVTSTYDGGIRITLAEPIPNGRAYTVVFEKPIALRSAKESYRLELMESLGDLLPWPTVRLTDRVGWSGSMSKHTEFIAIGA